jgi:hypothetical protein
MSDKILPFKHGDDEHLAIVVSHALDKSLDDIDDLSLQRLKNARMQALQKSNKPARPWLPLSIAASVAALLLIPILGLQYMQSTNLEQNLDFVASEIPFSQDGLVQDAPLSSQEMDDLEMLMALEEIDV